MSRLMYPLLRTSLYIIPLLFYHEKQKESMTEMVSLAVLQHTAFYLKNPRVEEKIKVC